MGLSRIIIGTAASLAITFNVAAGLNAFSYVTAEPHERPSCATPKPGMVFTRGLLRTFHKELDKEFEATDAGRIATDVISVISTPGWIAGYELGEDALKKYDLRTIPLVAKIRPYLMSC